MMDFRKIGVVGFGVMGTQISLFFALKGFEVVAVDVEESRLKSGFERITHGPFGLNELKKRGKIDENIDEILNRIKGSTTLKDISDCDIVIESVTEDVDLKLKVLEKIGDTCPNSVIGSNTSTISITKLSKAVKNRDRFLGIHFFNPAHIQKLVEIVRGLLTDESVVESIKSFFIKLEKVPVVVNDSPGFATSRLGLALAREAILLVQEGVATPQDIDIAMMLGYGHSLGPLETGDLVGLDTRLKAMEAIYKATGEERWAPPKLLIQLVDAGYLGDREIKYGSLGGIYDYFGQEKASKILKRMSLRK